MEDEKTDEDFYVAKRMRQLKHCLVFIAFGAPMLFFLLNLLIWPSKWIDIYSNPTSIQLVWCSIVPIAVPMLIYTEAYGERIKMSKCYCCTTLFVYESIWFLSIVNLVFILMNTWSIEEYIEELKDMPTFGSQFFVSFSKFLYVITSGMAYFLHWIKNTFVHISLCHSKILACEPKKTQYDFNPRFAWFLEYFLPIIFVVLSSILIVHNNMAFFPMKHGFFLPIYYVACIAVSKANVSSRFFMGKNQKYVVVMPVACCCIFILITIKLEFLADYDLSYPDCIFFWICCLSIGRQWFLDMEIYPEKYVNHFKNKFGFVCPDTELTDTMLH